MMKMFVDCNNILVTFSEIYSCTYCNFCKRKCGHVSNIMAYTSYYESIDIEFLEYKTWIINRKIRYFFTS